MFHQTNKFCWYGLSPLVPSDKRVTANQYKVTDHLYLLMKHFYPDEICLFQDNPASIYRAGRLTEWCDVQENGVSHRLWPSQSQISHQLNDYGSFWSDVVEKSELSSKHQWREYLWKNGISPLSTVSETCTIYAQAQ